jgi:hypothetical protein
MWSLLPLTGDMATTVVFAMIVLAVVFQLGKLTAENRDLRRRVEARAVLPHLSEERRTSIDAHVRAARAAKGPIPSAAESKALTEFFNAHGMARLQSSCHAFGIRSVAELTLLGKDELGELAGVDASRLEKALKSHVEAKHLEMIRAHDTSFADDDEDAEEDRSRRSGRSPSPSVADRAVLAKREFRGSVVSLSSFAPGVTEGYLSKLSTKSRWQRRYYRLAASNHYLLYFSNIGAAADPKKLKAAIDVRQIELVQIAPEFPTGAECEITWTSLDKSGKHRDFRVRADNHQEAVQWHDALSKAVAICRKEARCATKAEPANVLPIITPRSARAAAATGSTPLSISHFSEQERSAIIELRTAIADVPDAPPGLKDDATMVRFLRARGLVIADAEKMWRDHVTWRKTYNVAAKVEWFNSEPTPPEVEFYRM